MNNNGIEIEKQTPEGLALLDQMMEQQAQHQKLMGQIRGNGADVHPTSLVEIVLGHVVDCLVGPKLDEDGLLNIKRITFDIGVGKSIVESLEMVMKEVRKAQLSGGLNGSSPIRTIGDLK